MAKNKKLNISNNELFELQKLTNFINALEPTKKSLLNIVKKLVIYLTFSTIFIISYLIFKKTILLLFSILSIAVPALVETVKNEIKEIKSLMDSNYTPEDDFSEIEETLSKDLTKNLQDFYTDEFKKAIATPIPKEREEYLKALLKQKEKRIESLKSRKALEITVLDEFVDYLEAFGITLNISEDNINRIFDYIYSYLQAQNRIEEYYGLIDLIMRTVVQNAISRNQKAINLENFTASFNFLLEIGLVSNFEDIDILFKEIIEFINEQETLSEETITSTVPQCKIIEFKPNANQNKNM